MSECDNVSRCHNPVTVAEGDSADRVLCQECKRQYVVRKDWRGIHLNRQFSKIFKREILQGNDNLFYKYYPHHLKT